MLEQLTVLDERVQVESFNTVFLPGGVWRHVRSAGQSTTGACWRISMSQGQDLGGHVPRVGRLLRAEVL